MIDGQEVRRIVFKAPERDAQDLLAAPEIYAEDV
jgi:hypothetical protein